jgi:hypothetical protein
MPNEHEFDQLTSYCIIVKDALDSSWEDWFDGFSISAQADRTVLNGIVRDHALP